MRPPTKKLILLFVALGLTTIAGVALLLCREGDCVERLKDDLKRVVDPRPAPRRAPAPEVARASEPARAAEPKAPLVEAASGEIVDVPHPVTGRPCPGTERPTGCYERKKNLKRRFAEGGTLTRVSRPRPENRLALEVPEPEPAVVWVPVEPMAPRRQGPTLRRRIPSWRAPLPEDSPLPRDLGQMPAFDSLLPE